MKIKNRHTLRPRGVPPGHGGGEGKRNQRVYLEVNGHRSASLEAVAVSLRHGQVGMGSFDETGDFWNVKIHGEAKDSPAPGRQ